MAIFFNYLQTFQGVLMIAYSFWMLNQWNNQVPSPPPPAGPASFDVLDSLTIPSPWYIYILPFSSCMHEYYNVFTIYKCATSGSSIPSWGSGWFYVASPSRVVTRRVQENDAIYVSYPTYSHIHISLVTRLSFCDASSTFCDAYHHFLKVFLNQTK